MTSRKLHIDITPRTFHFKQPARTSRGVYTTRRSWFVTITPAGMQGEPLSYALSGECAPLPDLSCDDVPHYETTLRDLCQLIEHTGQLPYDLLRPYPSMLFGLETAFLRAFHSFSSPVQEEFLSQPFCKGEEGIPINGLVWMGTHDEMLQRIEEKTKAGFRCIKLKIGAIDFERELGLIRHIRQRYSPEQIELRLDANGAFSPDEALKRLEQLAPYVIHSIEQPIRQGQWKEMNRICRLSPIPIALDEELIGINLTVMKEALLDEIRPAYIILKPSLHGGMHGTQEWIQLARKRNIGSWITSALESNVGLDAIACLAAHLYGPHITMPQGLGTGQLFTDNIPLPLTIHGDMLWRKPMESFIFGDRSLS